MSFINIENVKKIYQPNGTSSFTTVLHGISTDIEEGEFVALMGPSGSGKTTLLTIIGAMNQPTEGRVVVDEIDIYSLSEEKRADFRREYLGFVFQQHHLLPYLTAIENVMLPLTITKLSSSEKKQKALIALDRVGLADKWNRLPNQLSGGEQGRVAIARALVNEPPLILADEPTGNLDSKTGSEIIEVLRSLNEQGQTIVMVTHNPEAAAEAHRILRIQDGLLLADEAYEKSLSPGRGKHSIKAV
ncbi:MAG: ABC transporter ATP-binding protein [Acidobacteria bacterium]|nr:ABC transporter ATP-binding protein [Acidobacteriota bacterium]